MADVSSPIAVSNDGIFTKVSAGLESAFAIRSDGRVLSWGDNTYGQLGDNTITGKSTPGLVVGGHQFANIAAGWHHVLGLKADGSVWSWGRGDTGQLGLGSATLSASSPSSVIGGHSFIKVDAGECHSIGLKADGSMWTWGCSGEALGEVDFEIGAIGTWYYGGMAIDRNTGFLWVWGSDAFATGQTGTNTTLSYSSPVTVAGPQGWAANTRHLVDQSWGNPDDYGDFGGFDHPCDVVGNCKGIQGVESNSNMAIKLDGSVWCWGDGSSGNLGQGGANWNNNYSSPRSVVGTGPGEANEVFWSGTKAGNTTYALNQYGTLYAWGDTNTAMTGFDSINSPVNVIAYMTDQCGAGCTHPLVLKKAIRQLDCTGDQNACVIVDWQGEGYTWGYGNGTQCDGLYTLGYNSPKPVIAPYDGGGWKMGGAGLSNTIWLDGNGNVWMCGYNPPTAGMSPPWFGGGGPTARSTPTIVLGSPHSAIKVRAADSDDNHAFLRADGTLWTWGANSDGTLGTGDLVSRTSPASVLGSGVSYKFVDFEFLGEGGMVAITDTGQVYGWGPWYAVGDNTKLNRSEPTATSLSEIYPEINKTSPTQITGALWQSTTASFKDIAAGNRHNLATSDNNNQGWVWTWGANASGQLGHGDQIKRSVPTVVASLSGAGTDIEDIAAGTDFSYILDNESQLWAWGDDACGKLGDGIIPDYGIGAAALGMGAAIDKNTGVLWTWGFNNSGMLGDGTITNRSSPVSVLNAAQGFGIYPPISQLGTGPCDIPGNCDGIGQLSDNVGWAMKTDGSTWIWGSQEQGQLGVGGGYTTNYSSPRSVLGSGENKFWAVASTGGSPPSSYFLSADGTLWVAGYTGYVIGGLGAPASINSPINVQPYLFAQDPSGPFVNVVGKYVSGGTFGGLVGTGARVYIWGSGTQGRMCLGDTSNRLTPVQIPGASWIHAAHAADNTILLDTSGNVWICGSKGNGLAGIGKGPPSGVSTPTLVTGAPHLGIKVAASQNAQYFGVLREDGSLWMWGTNTYGQLGDGTTVSKTSPVSVLGSGTSYSFTNFILGGETGTVAVDTEGNVYGWGTWFHVGDNTTNNRSIPTLTSLPAPAALNPYSTTPKLISTPW